MTKKEAGSNGIAGRVRQANQARILAAAEQVFAQRGFAGATMAEIAAAADLPKANLHYYFGTKEALYLAVLEDILALWLDATDGIRADRHPAVALGGYIRAKMAHSRTRPLASKVFANELLHGAPHIRPYLALELRRRVEDKVPVIEGWIAQGLMDRVDAKHLFFSLWAMTQTYADFDVQIRAVLGVATLDEKDFSIATETVIRLILKGCGIALPNTEDH
ncbi:MAG TPA: TetR/AcrR family transcriptional regulator [Stellaceae bacterium]|nr:TetR/AcrR family transcriptional regulator [Stellaceae bacterium]